MQEIFRKHRVEAVRFERHARNMALYERDPVEKARSGNGSPSQRDHRSRAVDCSDMKLRPCLCQPDHHVPWTTADVDRCAQPLWKVAIQSIHKKLVRYAEVCLRIRD